MEKRFNCNKKELTQSRITFWVYAVCIPIIVFLFVLPYIRGISTGFNPFSIIYILIVLYLIFEGYRSLRVLISIKRSYCVVNERLVSGISIQDPVKKGEPFEINRSEILGVGKTKISVGGMRSHNALAVNTKQRKYVLFAIENPDELIALLNSAQDE